MTIAHLLEDFTSRTDTPDAMLSEAMIEDIRLEAFEKGYRAGWDDSANAQRDSAASVSEDFARNLRDLSFTYHEAWAGFVAAMRPLIGQIVDAVLPDLARATLGTRVAALLQEEFEAHGPQPVVLRVAPSGAAPLRAMLPDQSGIPVRIVEDPGLADGQVQIRIAQVSERDIDLAAVLDGIGAAIDGYLRQAAPTLKETA